MMIFLNFVRLGQILLLLVGQYIILSSPVALAVVRSKVVVLLLLIHCLLLRQLSVGVLCLVLVLLCSTFGPFSFVIISVTIDRLMLGFG